MSDELADFDYVLPPELIAQRPLEDRAASRMLHLPRDGSAIRHRAFRELPTLLHPGDLLVFNQTRVTARRLRGLKESGGAVEALLVNRLGQGRYRSMVKPMARLRGGSRLLFGDQLWATYERIPGEDFAILDFSGCPHAEDTISAIGEVPLPPYIHERLSDPERYQTVYAQQGESAAAPTAGLHFTEELLATLRDVGVNFAYLNLNVSTDTFRPIQASRLEDHPMHGETYDIDEAVAEAVATCPGRVIAVGTTTVRALESAATGPRSLSAGSSATKLFIRPGYAFRVIDGMLTNFHLPRTTMLLMLAALVGKSSLMEAYAEAVRERYRFLSFGDSMLIL